MSIKAYVLIVTDPGKTSSVNDALRDVPHVVERHQVMGPYDILVEIEVDSLQDVPAVLGERIRVIDGIQSTTSLVALPE
jgi:DNA-binding Lrp family transcriptional regulator